MQPTCYAFVLLMMQAIASCSALTCLQLTDAFYPSVRQPDNGLRVGKRSRTRGWKSSMVLHHDGLMESTAYWNLLQIQWLFFYVVQADGTTGVCCVCIYTLCAHGSSFCGQAICASHLRALAALPQLQTLNLHRLPWAEDAVQLGPGWLVARLPCLRVFLASHEVLVRPRAAPRAKCDH